MNSSVRIAVVGAYPNSVVGFRGDLIRALVEQSEQLTVMTADCDAQLQSEIEELGVEFRSYPVLRNSMNPRADLKTLGALKTAFREMRPNLILAYTIKPIIWGGIAARQLSNCKFHALITGLGYAFQGTSWKRRILNRLVASLYKYSLSRAESVTFQNPDNRDLFVERGIVPIEKCHVVAGSGVNTHDYETQPLPKGPPTFLLIARLLGEKGIREYAEAARLVKKEYPEARFQLVGPSDPSPDGIPIEEINALHSEGIIEYLGATADVRPFLAKCHVYVLPSYHEGMPRTVLEAMATGRPILTTDVTGCRETVVQDTNGWLVESKNSQALAERLRWFLDNQDRWEEFAAASRRLVEDRFDVRIVNRQMMKILGLEEIAK